VLIHDAARPFVDAKSVSAAISAARRTGAAVSGVKVKGTIKKVTREKIVKETLRREELWEIQTPQVFKKELLLRAYKRFGCQDVTDDAALVEKLGLPVSISPGSYLNIKITTPEDLIFARGIWNTVLA
jgi:2-C-methyl-D-erythritol 4-phosphate cytidylyltransferase